jgi:hypothetical protein
MMGRIQDLRIYGGRIGRPRFLGLGQIFLGDGMKFFPRFVRMHFGGSQRVISTHFQTTSVFGLLSFFLEQKR